MFLNPGTWDRNWKGGRGNHKDWKGVRRNPEDLKRGQEKSCGPELLILINFFYLLSFISLLVLNTDILYYFWLMYLQLWVIYCTFLLFFFYHNHNFIKKNKFWENKIITTINFFMNHFIKLSINDEFDFKVAKFY